MAKPTQQERQRITTEDIGEIDANRLGLATVDKNVAIDTFAPMEGFDVNDRSGKEGITGEDWKPAFLCIAQLTSKAKDETDDAYIEGLKLGDLYNSETREIYGKGPVYVQLLRHRKRAFLPDENGRMGEEVKWGDPRCEWPDEDTKRTWTEDGKKGKPKPEAVRCYDWVAILHGPIPQIIVITFKSKSFGVGQTLTKFADMIQGPAYTAVFAITSRLKENDAGKFGVFAIAPAGKPTNEQALFAKKVYETTKEKEIPTDRTNDDGADDATGEKAPF